MNKLIFTLLSLLFLSGCAGVNSTLRVETRGLPPAFGLALANGADAVQGAIHETIVGSPGHGRFSNRIRIDVDERRGRTTVYSNRNWSAR